MGDSTWGEMQKLLRENERLRTLVRTIIDNDPLETIADSGETVLDGWRDEARRAQCHLLEPRDRNRKRGLLMRHFRIID